MRPVSSPPTTPAAAAEGLNDRIIGDADRGDFTVDMRGREDLLQIQNQVVFLGLHAGNFAGLDEVVDGDAQCVH